MPARSPTVCAAIFYRSAIWLLPRSATGAGSFATEIGAAAGGADEEPGFRMLMETGVTYDKLRPHQMGYFSRLMSTHEEIRESVRPGAVAV